jgi:hypothetical protein
LWYARGDDNEFTVHELIRLQTMGKYHDAEVAAGEVFPWIRSSTGDTSPQTLGCLKTLVKSLWLQGCRAEAQQWIDKCQYHNR